MVQASIVVRPVLRSVPKLVDENEARVTGELTWYFGSYESEMGLQGVDYERGDLSDGRSAESSQIVEIPQPDGKVFFFERPAKKDPRSDAFARGQVVRDALGKLTYLQQFTLEALFTPGQLTNGRQVIRVATGDIDSGRIGHHSPTLRALVQENGSIEAGVSAWEASGKDVRELWARVKRESSKLKADAVGAYISYRRPYEART